MVSAVHPLIKGLHYRELSVREGGAMRFELRSSPVTYRFSEPVMRAGEVRSFHAKDFAGCSREWLRIEPHHAMVMPYYRWNGNSIKRVVLGVRVGTPDFQGDGRMGSTIEKSLLHDALFQFSTLPELVEIFDLHKANQAYREIEGAAPFRLNDLYCKVLDKLSANTWGKPDSVSASVACVKTIPAT